MFRAEENIRPQLETTPVEVNLRKREGEEEEGGYKTTKVASPLGEKAVEGEEGPQERFGGMLPQEDSNLLARRVCL